MKLPSKINKQRRTLILLIVILILAELAALVYFGNLLRRAGSPLPVGEVAPTSTAGVGEVLPAPTEQGGVPPLTETVEIKPTETAPVSLPTPDPWNGKGRVTILLMGLDNADWESADRTGPPRSDTMILLTIDPISKKAGMLSIPRDLWVSIPGIEGEHKINTAYRFGEFYQMPGGGPGLAMRTVEKLLSVPINFYAVVDFNAFESLIDELGGIEVDVPGEIKVDPIGPDNTVDLQPGLQLLDGPTALAYARNRSTRGDETDRARRQQQVIMGIRDQVFSLDQLPALIQNAPTMFNILGEGIRTNLTLEQAIRLAWLAQEILPEDIQRASIGDDEVINDTSPDGQAIFVPILERVLALRDKIFASAAAGSSHGMTAEELVAAEYSRITIVNQTGNEALGELTATYLRDNGINVIQTVFSEESRPLSRLVDHAGDPNTLRYLINLLNIPPAETYIDIDPAAGTDLVVYLGLDWAEDNPLQKTK